MSALGSELRSVLAKAVVAARRDAEEGFRKAVQALAVPEAAPYPTMDGAALELRRRLRAHGRQLGDRRDAGRETQEIGRLVREGAYEHWHRMLFARFLAENGLLIEPITGVAISLDEARDLAREQGRDPWAYAAACAQVMLPMIFRPDDPVLAVTLPAEVRQRLEKTLGDLPAEVFLADDALGWTYQFWRSEEKNEVNARVKSGEKITGETLPAVTQLFTEHYMVEFLLHNTIGAWYAGRVFARRPELLDAASSEDELRAAVAIPGCDFSFLRFVRGGEASDGPWRIAAGTYDAWPAEARALTVLDPCCGSGHFLVAAFDLLVRLRSHEEGLALADAVSVVLRENLFGLEIDARCTQIAAFAVALHAWKLLGRVVALPRLNLACSGLSVGGSKAEWVKLAGDDERLRNGMDALYDLFEQAPILGSLIDPVRMLESDHLFDADWSALLPLLDRARGAAADEAAREAGVAAAGMVDAERILRGKYTMILTNPPYLGRGKQSEALRDFAEKHEKDAKQDLATMFLSSAFRWCTPGATVAMVLPQNWLFLTSYRKLRERLLTSKTWTLVARLGAGAFQEISGEVVQAALVAMSHVRPTDDARFLGVDAANRRRVRTLNTTEMSRRLAEESVSWDEQTRRTSLAV